MTTAVLPGDELTHGPAGSVFRTCPVTGRRIDLGAQRLIKTPAVASVVSLLIGAVAAVLIVLTRWHAQLTRISDVAPAIALTDQSGREVSLESYRGRPVIVTFAFAHCQTVCPLIVGDVLAARRQIDGVPPAVLVITLDPWRDTPSRLETIASSWRLDGDAHVLSGAPDVVERTLNAWRVPRARNQQTGDVSHPSIVYIVDAGGRIAYAVSGGAEVISAAVRAL